MKYLLWLLGFCALFALFCAVNLHVMKLDEVWSAVSAFGEIVIVLGLIAVVNQDHLKQSGR